MYCGLQVKDEIIAHIRAQGRYKYLLTNDKKLQDRIKKKWGNEKAALERTANKAIPAGKYTNAGHSLHICHKA